MVFVFAAVSKTKSRLMPVMFLARWVDVANWGKRRGIVGYGPKKRNGERTTSCCPDTGSFESDNDIEIDARCWRGGRNPSEPSSNKDRNRRSIIISSLSKRREDRRRNVSNVSFLKTVMHFPNDGGWPQQNKLSLLKQWYAFVISNFKSNHWPLSNCASENCGLMIALNYLGV